MDIIEMTRNLGKEIQKEQAYIKYHLAQANSDDDQELQKLIGEFNLKRMNINTEAAKEDRNEEEIAKLNTELRGIYQSIMENQNMIAYNEAKGEIDALIQRITVIITKAADGEDPETCDIDMSSCGGSCSSCSGCH